MELTEMNGARPVTPPYLHAYKQHRLGTQRPRLNGINKIRHNGSRRSWLMVHIAMCPRVLIHDVNPS